MITSSVTLLLAGAAYVTYDLVTFRHAMTRDLLILAEIIGRNSTAALAFDDPQAGAATLASFGAEEHIVSACRYTKTRTLFAAYHRGRARTDVLATDDGRLSGTGHLAVSRPIVFDGEVIGTISIESDLRAFYSRLTRYASIGVVVMLASSLVGWLLSIQLQRVISDPVRSEERRVGKEGRSWWAACL